MFKLGDKVIANENSDYHNLVGEIIEIRTGDEKDTYNIGDDIYVCFEVPEREIEKELEKVMMQPIDKIVLDEVIMAEDMIELNI